MLQDQVKSPEDFLRYYYFDFSKLDKETEFFNRENTHGDRTHLSHITTLFWQSKTRFLAYTYFQSTKVKLDVNDKNHDKAAELRKKIEREGYFTLTTNFVIAEAHALILSNLGANVAREWLRNISIPMMCALCSSTLLLVDALMSPTHTTWQVDKSEEYEAKEIIFCVFLLESRISRIFS